MKWPLKRLAELGTVSTGSTPRTAEPRFYGGELPFVTPAELDTGLPVTTAPRTLTDEGAEEARVLPEGAVMVCCIGSLGKIGIAGRPVATNQQINSVVFDREKVWPGFGFYACRLLKPKLDCMAPATTLPIVSKSKFADLTIPVPPLVDQRRIADVLDRAEALRAKRRAALAQLDSLTQSIFLDLFGDPATNPRGWPTGSLGSVLSIPLRNGLSPSKSGKVNAKVLTLSAITGDRFDATAWKISTFMFRPPANQSVSELDFLICRGNGNVRMVGKGYFPSEAKPEITFPDTMIAARISTERIERAFLQHVWNSSAVRKQVESVARTTNGTFKVNQPSLERIHFVLPPISLQREFARRVAAVENLKAAQRASLVELDALFASLQHRAFRGEL